MSFKKAACPSRRIRAIVFSVLIFVGTALFTLGAALGQRHAREAGQRLFLDLDEEEASLRGLAGGRPGGRPANRDRLQCGETLVLMVNLLLNAALLLGCANQLASSAMLYGLVMQRPNYMFPWVVVAGCTYIIAGLAVMACLYEYFGVFWLLSAAVPTAFFAIAYSTITAYWLDMRESLRCTKTAQPTVVPAYGGYSHTLLPQKP